MLQSDLFAGCNETWEEREGYLQVRKMQMDVLLQPVLPDVVSPAPLGLRLGPD